MSEVCLVAWNCRSGSLAERLADLAPCAPDLVFLQECRPSETLPLAGRFIRVRVNSRKSVALGSPHDSCHVSELDRRGASGRAVVAAAVSGPATFNVLGIWSQGPRYVDDVMKTLDAYEDVLRSGPTVVMGDFNSGTKLTGPRPPTRPHSRLLDAFAGFGLLSAYHVFNGVEHGCETHPTYRHHFKVSQPWHIDFCFVPTTWRRRVKAVELLDGKRWRQKSDHHPLLVKVRL